MSGMMLWLAAAMAVMAGVLLSLLRFIPWRKATDEAAADTDTPWHRAVENEDAMDETSDDDRDVADKSGSPTDAAAVEMHAMQSALTSGEADDFGDKDMAPVVAPLDDASVGIQSPAEEPMAFEAAEAYADQGAAKAELEAGFDVSEWIDDGSDGLESLDEADATDSVETEALTGENPEQIAQSVEQGSPDETRSDTDAREVAYSEGAAPAPVAAQADDVTATDWFGADRSDPPVLPFDPERNGLVFVWDDSIGPQPAIAVTRSAEDPDLTEVLMGDAIVARVRSKNDVQLDHLRPVPLSEAQRLGWASAT